MVATLASLRQIDREQSENTVNALKEDNKAADQTKASNFNNDKSFIETVGSTVKGFAEAAYDALKLAGVQRLTSHAKTTFGNVPFSASTAELVVANNMGAAPESLLPEAINTELATGSSIGISNNSNIPNVSQSKGREGIG